ncbi:hypothetical protein GCM10009664_75290 [Kitasatospora gansuensis]
MLFQLQLLNWLIAQYFDNIFCQCADFLRFLGIGWVVFEHVAILFDKRPAAAGRLNNGFSTLFYLWPPCIDIGTHASTAIVLGIKVEIDGTAAACFTDRGHTNAESI